MKKLLLIAIAFIGITSLHSQIPDGYKVKVYGYYHPGSGGNGNAPICDPDPDRACVIVKAITGTSTWNPSMISSAQMEIQDNIGTWIPISSISKVVTGSVFEMQYTSGTVWVGPFWLLPADYSVTPY